MELVQIKTKDLRVGDIIGEGQRVWAVQWSEGGVTAWWGDTQTEETKLSYTGHELIRILRLI